MNRLMSIAFLVVQIVFVIYITSTDAGERLDKAVEGVKGATEKTANNVKSLTDKTAQGVYHAADGIKVKVEKFENPPQHQPGQHNIVSSAVRGVGRLLRNVTLETGKYIHTVATSTYDLTRATGGATMQTVRDSANRIANPRHKAQSNGNDQATPQVPEAPAQAGDGSSSQPPNELHQAQANAAPAPAGSATPAPAASS